MSPCCWAEGVAHCLKPDQGFLGRVSGLVVPLSLCQTASSDGVRCSWLTKLGDPAHEQGVGFCVDGLEVILGINGWMVDRPISGHPTERLRGSGCSGDGLDPLCGTSCDCHEPDRGHSCLNPSLPVLSGKTKLAPLRRPSTTLRVVAAPLLGLVGSLIISSSDISLACSV